MLDIRKLIIHFKTYLDMKTVETVMLQTLLFAKNLVSNSSAYDFTGKAIPASELVTMLIMTHPAKDNILAVLTNTFDFNQKFGVAYADANNKRRVLSFVEFCPLEEKQNQIKYTRHTDKTGWYANEENAKAALSRDSYNPQDKPSNSHQFFVQGAYTTNGSMSVRDWNDYCEQNTPFPLWYECDETYTEHVASVAAQELMDFRASQNAH